MALILCSECGKEISDKAEVCINCGCPIQKYTDSGKVTIKASGSVSFKNEAYKMEVCNTNNEILCTILPGEMKTIEIKKDMDIFVRPPASKWFACSPGQRSASSAISVSVNKTTKLLVTYSDNIIRKYILSEVEQFVL